MRTRQTLITLISCAALAAVASSPARAIDLPHNASQPLGAVGCKDCHSAHPGGAALVRRDTVQRDTCLTCHNPTGTASAKSDVAMHVVSGGTITVDCGSCHDPHGPQGSNLSLIREDTDKYRPTAVTPAVFQTRPDDYALGASPYNRICETCHTATTYHQNNAGGDHGHNLGADCTTCHAHVDRFLPQGCADCHNSAQGTRRAVIGEFASGTTHQHLGDPANIADADCLVCHDLSTHQSGTVRLVDPDNDANIISFAQWSDINSDPAVSGFCSNCHDGDGATRLGASALNPFGNGNAPSDVKSRFAGTLQWREWYGADGCFDEEGTTRPTNSHHDISAADQAFSGAQMGCLSCHGAHRSADTQRLVDPFQAPSSGTRGWTGTVSEHCLTCHDGGSGPASPDMPPGVVAPTVDVDAVNGIPCDVPGNGNDCANNGSVAVSGLRGLASCNYTAVPWYVVYTWASSAHGGDSKRGWTGYSGAPAHDLACTVCHDEHGSYTATNPAGNPYMIRDGVDGTPYEDDGSRLGGFNGPPFGTFGQSRAVSMTVSGSFPSAATVDWGGATGLCSACHGSWQGADWWHDTCTSCQTCHNHGADWGGADWEDFNDDTACP